MRNQWTLSDQRSFSLILVIVLLALSGCGGQLVDDGSGFLKTQSGELVSWPSGSKVQFVSDESVPTELREHIYLGQEDLNSELGRVSVHVEVEKSSAPKFRNDVEKVSGDRVNGIYFLPEPWPWANTKGKENSDAMTVLINRGSTIVEADIFYRASTYSKSYDGSDNALIINTNSSDSAVNTFILNTSFAESALGSDEKWTKVAFIHECMHALGFTHLKNERDSIMHPSISNLMYENPFSTNDLLRIKKLY